jgi:16S rRNA (adenine1518-N6/adenine1519-N6)-dimethyltransferase
MIQLQARKSLGQHFLADKAILQRITGALGITKGDQVVEIGAGTGLLTAELLKTPLGSLISFEVDDRAVPELRAHFANEGERFKVEHQDILASDLRTLGTPENLLRVVGNIPYYITSPILFKLIEERSAIKDAVLLVQLEVAERLVASPRTKAYGIPTVIANFFGEVEYLFKVKSGAFKPPPKVDSAVIRINFQRPYFTRTGETPPAGFQEQGFQKFVRGIFRMRRKTIRNNLKGLVQEERIGLLPANLLGQRAEELGIGELIQLFSRVTSEES